jgi:K+-sensing histidine kinase KdpD
LTTLLGNANYLVRHGAQLEPGTIAPIARDLESDANRLYTVIENMLVLSQTKNGEHEIDTEPARLNRLAETTVRNFIERPTDRSVSLVASEGVSHVEVNHCYYDHINTNHHSKAHN